MTDILNTVETETVKLETEAKAEVVKIETEAKAEVAKIEPEAHSLFAGAKLELGKIEADIKHVEAAVAADVKTVVHGLAHLFEHATPAVVPAVTVAPVAAVAPVSTQTFPTTLNAQAITIPNAAEYAGAPKNNPAPQTLAASGKSRYAADGLTIDWFATHPRK